LGFGNLGFYNLATLYFTAAFASFIVPMFIRKFKIRMAFFIGAILGVPNYLITLAAAFKYKYPDSDIFLLNYYFIYTMSIVFGIFAGIGFVMVLIGYGEYISECASN
jgi:hypothetical protein